MLAHLPIRFRRQRLAISCQRVCPRRPIFLKNGMSRWEGFAPPRARRSRTSSTTSMRLHRTAQGWRPRAWDNAVPGDLCRLAWQANLYTVCFGGLASLVTPLC